jgi:GT2 family glycosyltransferase
MKKIIDFEKEVYFKKRWKSLSARSTNNKRKSQLSKIVNSEKKGFFKRILKKFSIGTSLLSVLRKDKLSTNNLTIIIPIYNAKKEVEKCLEALIRNTSEKINVILINDASTDPLISDLLECYKRFTQISLINNKSNLGYTKSINIGITSCHTDVIILNSDTEVTPNWTENLSRCAYSGHKVGTVTPFSNNAGAFSAPTANIHNEIPTWIEKESISTAITAVSSFRYPEIPTGSGFCLYIKRKLIEEIGCFDEKVFPIGYGEENDFCIRARNKGWKNKLDDSTYIFHARTASFKEKKDLLITEAKKKISTKYPNYDKDIRKFLKSEEISNARNNIKRLFEDFELTFHLSKPSILYVLHESNGGTPATSIDLAKSLVKKYRILFITSDRKFLRLFIFYNGSRHLLLSWNLNRALYPTSFTNRKYKEITKNIIINYNIKLIHIRHLIYHTFDFVYEASHLNIKVILSFHDFYFICPSVHLLDENNIYCGGFCTKTKGKCKTPYNFSKRISELKNEWINEWKQNVSKLFDHIDYFITTSSFTKNVYENNYPKLRKKNFKIIRHGRNFKHSLKFIPKCDGSKIKILCPGNLGNNKGIDFIAKLIDYDEHKGKRIEIHTIGSLSEEASVLFNGRVKNHGNYNRDEFHLYVNKIKPHFIGIFSIWPETYCHTLTEAWSCGIPILINSIGTLSERLSDNKGGGWEIDCNDVHTSHEKIIQIYSNEDEYSSQQVLCNQRSIFTVEHMAKEYEYTYKVLLCKNKGKYLVNKNKIIDNRILRIGIFIPNRYASYFIRINNYLKNVYSRDKVILIELNAKDFIDFNTQYKFDIVIIQRHAINPNLTNSLIYLLKKKKVKIIYEIDDDLININSKYYQYYSNSISDIVKKSDCVITTNNSIKKQLLTLNKRLNIKVIKNRLNNDYWGNIKVNKPSPRPYTSFLYMGTKTHTDDLYLVLNPLRSIAANYNIKLTLIGVTDLELTDDFIIQKDIPFNFQEYPYFSRLLKSQRDLYDIGLAPLLLNQLNINKSNLKYLDYTALGIPGIYSNIKPYSDSIKSLENGILVDDNNEAWLHALEVLILDKKLRHRLAVNAVNDVKTNFLLEDSFHAYTDAICEILKDE